MQTNGVQVRAAIYARKSTDDDAGVARQIELSLAFATTQNNDVSGGIFERDGLTALLRALFSEDTKGNLTVPRRPVPFDMLVMMESSRLGREMSKTLGLQLRITQAGVRIFHYQDGRELLVNTPTQKLVAQVDSFGAEDYRYQIGKKVSPALRIMAQKGYVTGTTPFGYTSEPVPGTARGKHGKELCVLRIHPEHAAIVVQIFTWSAAGWGIKKIADELNVLHPGLRKWSGASVREILNNEIYGGEIVFGKTRQLTTEDKKIKVAVPEKDWVREPAPHLRIVPEPLLKAVQKRKVEMFKKYERTAQGRLQGRPEFSLDRKHLLASFCVCSECGGRLVVQSRKSATARYRYLVCARHRGSKGLCANKWNVPLEPLTQAIVDHFTSGVLTAEAIAQVQADLAADADSSPERVAARRETLKAELGEIEKRVNQAVEALIAAPSSKALADALTGAEAQKEALQARLTQLDETQASIAKWTEAGHRDRVEQLVSDWQGALQGAPEVGRQILRKLLVGPILVRSWTDIETGKVAHSYGAHGTYGKALSGTLPNAWGFFAPEDEHGTGQRDDLRAELLALVKATPVGQGGPTS